MGSETKTWAELSQCSFLSLAFLMLSLLWQRDSIFLQKIKTFNSFNKQLYAWASKHCWVNTEKKTTPKAAMKQNRGSLLSCLFISNSGICIRQSADTRNQRSHHATSFLYSCGFKPPPMIVIFGPLGLCCKLYSPPCKTHSPVSFHLPAGVRFAFMEKQQQTSKDVRKGRKQRDQRPFSTCRCRVHTSVLLTPLPSNSKWGSTRQIQL